MSGLTKFTIRLREATVQVCRMALAQAEFPRDSDKGILIHDLKGRILTTGNLQLGIGSAIVLQEVLEDYARDNLREDSDLHKEAVMFSGALSDRTCTEFHDDVRLRQWAMEKLDAFPAEESLNKAIETANKAEQSTRALQDAMLREIFMGAPRKQLNIWGDVVKEEEPTKLSQNDMRKRAKTFTSDGFREVLRKNFHEFRMAEIVTSVPIEDTIRPLPGGDCWQHVNTHRVRLQGTKPVADAEAHDLLTGDSAMAYNEDMKVEGAVELLMLKHRRGSKVSDGVVARVSDFMKLPR